MNVQRPLPRADDGALITTEQLSTVHSAGLLRVNIELKKGHWVLIFSRVISC